jgi:hypothetical protein
MNDRKYRHRGYQESDTPSSGGRRPSGPRPERPEGPRGRGADQEKAVVVACHACGEKRSDPEAIRTDTTCVRCGADLHACAQCTYFDTSARWECTQKIPARIADKKRRNECTFFKAKESFDLTGARGGTATPDDARAAFERLFKK